MSSATPSKWKRILDTAFIVATLLSARLLVLLRLKRQGDGWRRTIGMALRSESSKFALTVFGLDAGDSSWIGRLETFLNEQPEARWSTWYSMDCSYPVPLLPGEKLRLTVAEYDADGILLRIDPQAGDDEPFPMAGSVRRTIVNEFNQTQSFPEEIRPFWMKELLWKSLCLMEIAAESLPQTKDYARQILGGAFVSIEQLPEAEPNRRFISPDFCRRRHPGWGVLNIVARKTADGRAMDLWFQIHHVAADGVPMQEMLSRLEQSWGISQPPVFPSPQSFDHLAVSCATQMAPRPMALKQGFIDFTPLLALRKRLRESGGSNQSLDIPVGALLIWSMAHQLEFARLKFACTVDVPADANDARSVNFAALRPEDYFGDGNEAGLARFSADFNQLVNQTRARVSPAYKATSALALLPPRLQWRAIEMDPVRTADTYGHLGISIIKDAKIFLSPMADLGFERGFIAIGGMGLAAEGGGRVGAVSIKGDAKLIETYPAAIQRAVNGCSEYVG